jgi:hypothetical protein
MFLVIKLSLYMFRPMMGHHREAPNTSKEMLHMYYMQVVLYGLHYIVLKHVTHNTEDLLWRNTIITGTHSKILTNWNIFINFNKSILTILSTSVTHTRQPACNTCEAFPLKCWSPPDDGPSLAETCEGLILLLKTLLHLMEFNPNFNYKDIS